MSDTSRFPEFRGGLAGRQPVFVKVRKLRGRLCAGAPRRLQLAAAPEQCAVRPERSPPARSRDRAGDDHRISLQLQEPGLVRPSISCIFSNSTSESVGLPVWVAYSSSPSSRRAVLTAAWRSAISSYASRRPSAFSPPARWCRGWRSRTTFLRSAPVCFITMFHK